MERATDMRRWQDWASFALGLWLAVSPWLADYAAHDVATANAAVCGLALAVAAHVGFTCDHLSTEWANLGFGLWLVVAPFIFAYESNVAAVNAVAVGLFVCLLSAWALELDREFGRIWHRLHPGH